VRCLSANPDWHPGGDEPRPYPPGGEYLVGAGFTCPAVASAKADARTQKDPEEESINFGKNKGGPMLERIIDGVLDVLMMALLVALAALGTLILGG